MYYIHLCVLSYKLDLCIRQPIQICIHRKNNSPKPVNHHLTLKERPKVKSKIRRFLAQASVRVGFTLQTSRINNKQVKSRFRFDCPLLTLKEGPKVKSDNIKRFPVHDFLKLVSQLQISRKNNKCVISTLKFCYPHLDLKAGAQVNDFLQVGFTLQTSKTNDIQVISTFKFGYPHLTLKEGSKVKSDHTKRFLAHDFLYVGLPSQTSTTNKK